MAALEVSDGRSLRELLWNPYNQTWLGLDILQRQADIVAWELVLGRINVGTIIELGTWHWGMSAFLALQARYRLSAEFYTFDVKKHPGWNHPLVEALDIEFALGDIFGEGKDRVVSTIENSPGPVLLYCDNGDKPREVRTFAPYLQPNDYLCVHDWGTEIFERDMEVPFQLQPLGWRVCEALKSLTRFWRVLNLPSAS